MQEESKKNIDIDYDVLDQAFRMFDETTSKFQEGYKQLEEKVAYLSKELQEKNEILSKNVLQLDRMRKYLNSVLENISDGVIVLNLDGTIITFNKAAQIITDFSCEEIIGKSYKEIFVSKNNEDFPDAIIKKALFPSGRETVIKNKSGEHVSVIVYASFITDKKQNIVGIVITISDLTKVRKLENEIEQSKRLAALGEMAAGVAHEIRNPLGGIEMFASHLERQCQDDEEKRNIAKNIIQGVQSLNKIITGLLTFTRSFRKTHFEPIDLVDAFETSLAFAQRELQEKNICIKKEYMPTDVVMIVGDKDHLQQVFLNILLNAAQAIEHDRGAIHIKCSKDEGTGCGLVEIFDNGCGIEKAKMDKIFDPFFTTRSQGTGLGLAISYRIIEAHDGKIKVASKRNEGTRFSTYIPLSRET